MRALFIKRSGGYLEPCGDAAEKLVASIKAGNGMWVDAKKARNVKFHRKCFELLRTAYEYWDPEAAENPVRIRGIIARKNFESFRKDILVLAGHCEAYYHVDGSVSFEALSISFEECDQFDFETVYRNVLNVVWDKVMKHAKYAAPEVVDNMVNTLLSFT